jgi:D-alanyl-D-alanine carboxypeptidase
MRIRLRTLLNTTDIELWPAWLLHARSNADARILSRANHVLRRKCDGCYLAASLPQGVMPLLPNWTHGINSHTALDALVSNKQHADEKLPLDGLLQRLHLLGLDESYGERTGLDLVAEPATLFLAGFDRYQRALWLTANTARAWNAMQCAASRDNITFHAISGYRSHDYQLGIFERKLARGQTIAQILTVNAAPGYSEHHSGRAIDIGTPGEPPAEESFENTAAFAWLCKHAENFGFHMSYPRNNPHGIVYEPWHWCFTG